MFVTLIADIITVLHWYCGYADCRFCTILFGILCIITQLFTPVQLPLLVARYYDILSDRHHSAMFSIIQSYCLTSLTRLLLYQWRPWLIILRIQRLTVSAWSVQFDQFVVVGKAAGFEILESFFLNYRPLPAVADWYSVGMFPGRMKVAR